MKVWQMEYDDSNVVPLKRFAAKDHQNPAFGDMLAGFRKLVNGKFNRTKYNWPTNKKVKQEFKNEKAADFFSLTQKENDR